MMPISPFGPEWATRGKANRNMFEMPVMLRASTMLPKRLTAEVEDVLGYQSGQHQSCV